MATYILHNQNSQSQSYYAENITVSDEDIGSHDSDSTCEDKSICESESRQKLKVELCKNFLENKLCPYKSKCKFAHGLEELLRNTQLGQNFRTKKCKIFYDKKYCKFGQRCNFKHSQSEKEPRKINRNLTILEEYPQIFIGYRSKSRVMELVTHS